MIVYRILAVYFFCMMLAVVFWTAYIRSLNRTAYARVTQWLSLAICIYVFGYAMELNADQREQILFWNYFEYLGIPFVSALWLTLGLIYSGRFSRRRWLYGLLIYSVPLISMVLRMSNEAHHLYFADTAFVQQCGKLVFIRTYGPWMYVQTVHSMGMVIIALSLFLHEFTHDVDRFTGKMLLVVLASVVAISGLVMSYLKPFGFMLDYMALCLPLACLLVIAAILRYDFLEIKALARSMAFETNKDALLLIGHGTKVIDFNRKAKQLFARVNLTLMDGHLTQLLLQQPELLAALLRAEASVIPLRLDGELRYFEISTSAVDRHELTQVCMKIITDVTEAFTLNQTLQRQALLDELSGVGNRRAFIHTGSEMLEQAVAEGSSLHLMMLDLDHFKSINDRFGHQTGDRVIQAIGQLLKKHFPASSLIARLGGEEFGVLLAGSTDAEMLASAEHFVRAVAATPLRSSDRRKPFHITASVGLAHLRRPDESLYDLMLMADKALYASKDAGRNRVSDFSNALLQRQN